jgi:hypothetical protein
VRTVTWKPASTSCSRIAGPRFPEACEVRSAQLIQAALRKGVGKKLTPAKATLVIVLILIGIIGFRAGVQLGDEIALRSVDLDCKRQRSSLGKYTHDSENRYI